MAWSAMGVLAIAAFLVVERIDDLRFHEDMRQRDAGGATHAVAQPPAPHRVAVAAESPLSDATAARPQAGAASSQATLSAARTAAKPHARPKPRASRSSPPRDAQSPAVVTIEAAPRAVEPLVVAVVAYEPAVRTRWDVMHDEIATCSTTDFLDGAICRQKVRIRYCPGWWGQTEDCPTRQNGYGG